MSDFNQVWLILFKSEDGTIKPVNNDEGGLRLFMTYSKAKKIADELGEKTGIYHYPHTIEINRALFE